MSDYVEKPPLGLKPLLFHNEQRFTEVCEAMKRYFDKKKAIPVEWVIEYNDLLRWLIDNESIILCQ